MRLEWLKEGPSFSVALLHNKVAIYTVARTTIASVFVFSLLAVAMVERRHVCERQVPFNRVSAWHDVLSCSLARGVVLAT